MEWREDNPVRIKRKVESLNIVRSIKVQIYRMVIWRSVC